MCILSSWMICLKKQSVSCMVSGLYKYEVCWVTSNFHCAVGGLLFTQEIVLSCRSIFHVIFTCLIFSMCCGLWMYSDIADGCNYQVVEHVVGHGLGSIIQSDPSIYHYCKHILNQLTFWWVLMQAFLDGAKSGYLMSLILACINPCTGLCTGWMVDPYFVGYLR
jgi:hypothetical protein